MPRYSDSATHRRTHSELVQAVRNDEDLPNEEWERLRAAATPQQRRVARMIVDPDSAPHGEPGTYTNWGCRCDPCSAAYAGSRKGEGARMAFQEETQDTTTPAQIQALRRELAAGRPLTPRGEAVLAEYDAASVL